MSTIKSKSIKRGKFIENIVFDYLVSQGFKDINKTTPDIDMNKHIDFTFYSEKLQKYIGIDVKAPTIVKGYGENEVNYATFINNLGEKGWLYGDADFAFLVTFEEFVIVKLSELREFLEEKTKEQEPLYGNPKQLYTKFHCSNAGSYRKSVSTLFKIEDVKKLHSTKSVKHNMKAKIKEAFKEIKNEN